MKISIQKVFLLDSIGALVTATLLSQLLVPFEDHFGMPKNILYVLSAIALIFAVYSFSCYKFLKSNLKSFLKVIMLANLSYCLGTFILMILYFDKLTNLGLAYFVGEIIVVILLVNFEKKYI